MPQLAEKLYFLGEYTAISATGEKSIGCTLTCRAVVFCMVIAGFLRVEGGLFLKSDIN